MGNLILDGCEGIANPMTYFVFVRIHGSQKMMITMNIIIATYRASRLSKTTNDSPIRWFIYGYRLLKNILSPLERQWMNQVIRSIDFEWFGNFIASVTSILQWIITVNKYGKLMENTFLLFIWHMYNYTRENEYDTYKETQANND